jgi:hypothetical protein
MSAPALVGGLLTERIALANCAGTGSHFRRMFDSLSAAWSRPYKIVRVLQALGMDVPVRLRRERLGLMIESLSRAGIEASLADGSPLNPDDSPGIEAKVRLRRAKSPSPPADNIFPGYELVAPLPSPAGMSQCFKVRKEGVVRFLKKVPADGDDAHALRREQQLYDRLDRAGAVHVLKAYDWLRGDAWIALVTDYADGGNLAEYLEEMARESGAPDDDDAQGLDVGRAKVIALAVLAGLRELHSLEIVHRDLKPENVVRCGNEWKLIDFGIGKSLARPMTQKTLRQTGTPGYAPPEQWKGAAASPSMDVYAFGKLLVFLLTAQTDVDRLVYVEHDAWADLARRCTALDPDLRPSVHDLHEAMSAL